MLKRWSSQPGKGILPVPHCWTWVNNKEESHPTHVHVSTSRYCCHVRQQNCQQQSPVTPSSPSPALLVQHRILLIAMACGINHRGESWICGFGSPSAMMACEHLPRQISAQLGNSLKQHLAPTREPVQVGSTQIVAVLWKKPLHRKLWGGCFEYSLFFIFIKIIQQWFSD